MSGYELYYMGKYLTFLLILGSYLFSFENLYADEQIRKVQEELRKRHLFYADANGEYGPALTAAIKRYQQRKGFAPTGAIDSATLASLGIIKLAPLTTKTPIVVGKRGDVHGANGERLPSYPPFFWPNHERVSEFDPATIDQHIVLALAPDEELAPQAAVKSNLPSNRRTRRVRPRKETNPIILTYQTVDRALRNLFGDAQPKRKRVTARRL